MTDLSSGANIQETQESCEDVALKERIRDREIILLKRGNKCE